MTDLNQITEEQLKAVLVEEYTKCAMNPIYFLCKYAVIQHPIDGKIPFALYDFQRDIMDEFIDRQFTIVLKARQLGLSTLVAGYALHMMLFGADKNILVIATKQETAKNLVLKVKVMYDSLPSWLKLRLVEDNKLGLRFTNGSQIKAIASNEEAGRTEALSLLILDEAAFIPKIDKIWAAASLTLATGGACIAISTPNGVGGWFHENWVHAEDRTGKFFPIILHWTVHPDRDQEWRDNQTQLLGADLANQECECLWGKSIITVRNKISGEIVNKSFTELYEELQC